MTPEEQLNELAGRQHGLVTRAQALALGVTRFTTQARLGRRRWVRVYHGVYRLPGAPDTPQQRAMAVCLALDGVACRRLAASLHGIPGVTPDLEVSVVGQRYVRLAAVRVYRVSQLDPVDRTKVDGVPVTTLARTVIDLAGVLPPADLIAVVDHVLDSGAVTLADLAGRLAALGTRGRRGAGTLASILSGRTEGGGSP